MLEKSGHFHASVTPIFAKTATYTTQRSCRRGRLASLLNHRGPIRAHRAFDFCPETLEIFLAKLLGTLITRVAPRQAPLNPTLRVY